MNLPEHIVIYGIQVADVTTFSETPTPEVEQAVPVVANQVWDEAQGQTGLVTFSMEHTVKLGTILELLDAELLTPGADKEREFEVIQASDLMSDVLTQGHHNALLITGLVNAQAIRTAEVVDLGAIVFARGKRPSEETIAMAEKSQLPLMATSLTMYEACGRLYAYQKER
jgi:hypothetical protein